MQQMFLDLFENQFFQGLFATSMMGLALYVLREVPSHATSIFKRLFLCSVTVYNDDSVFDLLSEWLTEVDYTKKARHNRLTTFGSIEGDSRPRLTPGVGWHWFRHAGTWVFLRRQVDDLNEASLVGRPECIEIVTLGPDVQKLRRVVGDFVDDIRGPKEKIDIFMYRYGWRKVAKRGRRDLKSIVLPEHQFDGIIRDIEAFSRRREWYVARGVPYRRTYLLEGPPGTGKTSFVMALAGYLGRPLYSLALGGIDDDNVLTIAMVSVPSHAILLIEDIDVATTASHDRTEQTPANEPKPERKGITLSGLLNMLDGVCTPEGRVVFLTTNAPDKLDPALVRKGRVNRREYLGLHGPREARRHVANFLDTEEAVDRWMRENYTAPIAPSTLQDMLVEQSEH